MWAFNETRGGIVQTFYLSPNSTYESITVPPDQLVEHEIAELQSDFQQVIDWFESADAATVGYLGKGKNSPDISGFSQQLDQLKVDSAICYRDSERGLCGVNEAARRWFGINDALLGYRVDQPASHWQSRLDESSERMLRVGAISLRFRHQQATPQGRWFEWETIKARLPATATATSEFGILAVSRPISAIRQPTSNSIEILEEQFSLFRKLDETDQEICHGIALGDTTCEIARAVGLTRRTVEVRRGKIMELFGFSRKVQIVRLIVRLEENGYFDEP